MDLEVLYVILYVLAAASFAVFTFSHAKQPRVHFLGLGVFFWSLVPLIQQIQSL